MNRSNLLTAAPSGTSRPSGEMDNRPSTEWSFTPSAMVLQQRGLLPPNNEDDPDVIQARQEIKEKFGISKNYQGNPWVEGNRSADIADDQNVSLFVQNLPSDCSYHELLSSFRNVGKILATHISPPGDGHLTCCAKVAFYTREAAAKLHDQISAGEIVIRGHTLRCRWNRVKVAPRGEQWHSRILLIVGPETEVTRQRLDECFVNNFVYNLDEIIDHGVVDGLGRLEYRFASYPCQAQFAYQAIRSNFSKATYVQYAYFDPLRTQKTSFDTLVVPQNVSAWSQLPLLVLTALSKLSRLV
ncbi:hypothetical protein DL765_003767 [Monosporascus sp. GIB2]|nr:hypothetical protein DL765_003767 [Monosporascus sp. GIB2]